VEIAGSGVGIAPEGSLLRIAAGKGRHMAGEEGFRTPESAPHWSHWDQKGEIRPPGEEESLLRGEG
jgi:hypothetical protein